MWLLEPETMAGWFQQDEPGAGEFVERMRAAGVRVQYEELESSHGHDGFLADPDRLAALVGAILHRPFAQAVLQG